MANLDYRQYLLLNKEIVLSSGKALIQAAHAGTRFERAVALDRHLPLFNRQVYYEWTEGIEKKIAVRAKLSLLEKLEAEGWVSVRDAGLNELPPNTLTVVISPPLHPDEVPNWLKRLQVFGA